jgi:hypothetical protein
VYLERSSTLAYSSTLKTEATYLSEIPGSLRTTWGYNPEDHTCLVYTHSLKLLGRVVTQCEALPNQHNTKSAHKHPCPEADSNPRSHWSTGRRQVFESASSSGSDIDHYVTITMMLDSILNDGNLYHQTGNLSLPTVSFNIRRTLGYV